MESMKRAVVITGIGTLSRANANLAEACGKFI